MYNVINSKYTYMGTNVLKNKLNIKNQEEFDKKQNELVSIKLDQIKYINFGNEFNASRLKIIHKFLFDEIYDFAGEYRTENITKDNFRFAQFEYIDENISITLKKIDIEYFKTLETHELVKKISDILTELNILHPFREGNGRTIREFIREFALECGYGLDLFKVPYELVIKVAKLAVVDETEQIKLLGKTIINKII